MIKKITSLNSGFGLMEVLIASAILAIMVGGSAVIGIMLTRSNVINTHRLQAAYLAQGAFETVKQIRDTNYVNSSSASNWDDGLTNCDGNKRCYINIRGDRKLELKSLTNLSDAKFTTKLNSVDYARFIKIENNVINNAIPNQNQGQSNDFKKRMKKVTVTVTWDDYGKTEKYEATTFISDWKSI